jgi:putative oxidoreductase
MKATFLIGRILFGGFFLYNGINHLKNSKLLAQYAGSKSVPMPDISVKLSGLVLLIGGTSILLGLKPKVGAGAIIAFLAGVSPMMHDFWRAEDPNQRTADMVHFTKNMALLGSALALAGVEEPWPGSLPVTQPSTADRVRAFARRRLAA